MYIGVALFFLIAIGATIIVLFETQSQTCNKTAANICRCSDTEDRQIIIDGDSVKLGNKTFTPEEVTRLKTKNSDDTDTTYSIFAAIDDAVRNCEISAGTTNVTLSGDTDNHKYTGQQLQGKAYGQGTW